VKNEKESWAAQAVFFDVKCYEIADREKIGKYFEVIVCELILDVSNLDSVNRSNCLAIEPTLFCMVNTHYLA
jgi:hypothetical protein